jgi:hypothetical protein
LGRGVNVRSGGVEDSPLGFVLLPCDVLGVDAHQNVYGVPCPLGDLGSAVALQRWKDEIATRATTIIAFLGQWFHLVRHNRKPTLERLAGVGGGQEIRRLIASQLIPAYDVIASYGDASYDLRIDQAELFAAAGMNARASVFSLSILDLIRK